MTGKTHLAIGLAATAALSQGLTPKTAVLTFAAAALGSLIVDLDHQNSTISRKLYFGYKGFGLLICLAAAYGIYKGYFKSNLATEIFIAASAAALITPHRSFTHSILGFLVFNYAVKLAYVPMLNSFAIGYAAHMIADFFTDSGIELLFPFRKRFRIGIVTTGSFIDTGIASLGYLAFAYLLATKVLNVIKI